MANKFPLVVAHLTWRLLEERKAILYRERKVFYVWTTVGTTAWLLFLLTAGYFLEEHYERVEGWLEPLAYLVVAGVLGTYVWHLWTTRVRGRR